LKNSLFSEKSTSINLAQKKFRAKKKLKDVTKSVSTYETISEVDIISENVVRLKVTVRKGARIESVPLKRLEKLANRTRLHWKLEDGWLTLYGLS